MGVRSSPEPTWGPPALEGSLSAGLGHARSMALVAEGLALVLIAADQLSRRHKAGGC